MTNKQNLDRWLILYKQSLADYELIQSIIASNRASTKEAYDMGEYDLARKFKSKLANLKNCNASIKRYGRLYSLECELKE